MSGKLTVVWRRLAPAPAQYPLRVSRAAASSSSTSPSMTSRSTRATAAVGPRCLPDRGSRTARSSPTTPASRNIRRFFEFGRKEVA